MAWKQVSDWIVEWEWYLLLTQPVFVAVEVEVPSC
jgi:hypothetical protein